MTREEAIKFIEERCKSCLALDEDNSCLSPTECFDVKRMAITALQGGDAEMQSIAKTPDYMQQIPSEDGSDLISRADAIEALSRSSVYAWSVEQDQTAHNWALKIINDIPSADAEPKWKCTANFVAEQLDRLRNMTDEEKWDFFIKFFSPSADRPTFTEEVREALMRLTMCAREDCDMCKYKDECGFEFQYNISTENMNTILNAFNSADRPTEDYSDLPDIPRKYYEKIVGNMSHEINMLKQQLEDRPTHERDLISRHEALMELNGACDMWEDDAIVADIIHKLPSIEIVRCKDCEYSYIAQTDSRGKMQRFCQRTPSFSRCVDDTDFCSWAKMKGGAE